MPLPNFKSMNESAKTDMDEKLSLIVRQPKIEKPKWVKNTLELKKLVLNSNKEAYNQIQRAKITQNGTIIIQAKTEELKESLLSSIPVILSDHFGKSPEITGFSSDGVPVKKNKSLVIHGIPSSLSKEEVSEEIEGSIPSVSEVVPLIKGGNTYKNPKLCSYKVSINDEEELTVALRSGIKIGFQLFRVEPWISLIHCFNCQKFNHKSHKCNSDKKCINCSGSHDREQVCQRKTRCANCGGQHKANYSKCPIKRATIEDLKIKHNGSS